MVQLVFTVLQIWAESVLQRLLQRVQGTKPEPAWSDLQTAPHTAAQPSHAPSTLLPLPASTLRLTRVTRTGEEVVMMTARMVGGVVRRCGHPDVLREYDEVDGKTPRDGVVYLAALARQFSPHDTAVAYGAPMATWISHDPAQELQTFLRNPENYIRTDLCHGEA